MLEDQDRAGVADRRFQKAFGIGGRCGRHDLEARHVCEQGRAAKALLASGTRNPAVRSAKHDRNGDCAARQIMCLGGRRDDCLEGFERT